ncbi:hypothetical protein ASE42_02060 [Bacillus sp. Root920]|nr:hypothetical protein ASE42_02060 [Bacillus sp. Root920]
MLSLIINKVNLFYKEQHDEVKRTVKQMRKIVLTDSYQENIMELMVRGCRCRGCHWSKIQKTKNSTDHKWNKMQDFLWLKQLIMSKNRLILRKAGLVFKTDRSEAELFKRADMIEVKF